MKIIPIQDAKVIQKDGFIAVVTDIDGEPVELDLYKPVVNDIAHERAIQMTVRIFSDMKDPGDRLD
jgi:hypothetical protein